MTTSTLKSTFAAIVAILTLAGATTAKVTTPERGSDERAEILDVIRVSASHDLGSPVIFIVDQLEVLGNFGFMRGTATRPNGRAIDISQSPMVLRDEIPLHMIDGATIQAFIKRLDGDWTVDDYSVGSTRDWWAGPPYCANYSAFLPADAC